MSSPSKLHRPNSRDTDTKCLEYGKVSLVDDQNFPFRTSRDYLLSSPVKGPNDADFRFFVCGYGFYGGLLVIAMETD
jgi:hypothetical protein